MSKNLKYFLDSLRHGFEMGSRIADRRDAHAIRRENMEIARANAAAAQRRHEDRMKNEGARTGGYLSRVETQNAKDRAKMGAGTGPAVNPALQGIMNDFGPVEGGAPQQQAPPNVTVELPDTIDAPPAMSGGADEAAARGGRMGRSLAQGVASGVQMGSRAADRAAYRQRPREWPGGQNTPGGVGTPAAPPSQAIQTSPLPDIVPSDSGAFRRGGAVRRFQEGGYVTSNDTGYVDENGNPVDDLDARARGLSPYQMAPARPARGPGMPALSGEPASDNDQSVIDAANRRRTYTGETPVSGPAAITLDAPSGPEVSRPSGGRPAGGTRSGRMVPPDETGGYPGPQPAWDGAQSVQRAESGAPPVQNDSADQYYPDDPGRSSVGSAANPAPRGGGGGGQRQAIKTDARLPLTDQRRTEAYDPVKDLHDPANARPVDPATGATRAAMAGAVSYADRVFGTGPKTARDPEQASLPENPNALRGKAMLFSGQGAADHQLVDGLFKTIDPDNKMSMDQKMMATISKAHDFYSQRGDKENADKSAFEVAQFANTMASQHGKEAIKLMQGGDAKGAVQQLIAGYNWLPDGLTADVEGNNVVLKNEQGKTVQSYALDQKAMTNIALGMATGQLGWDVMRVAGTGGSGAAVAPPGAAPAQQAAQPTAAPAGPQPQPPAAPTPTAGAVPGTPATTTAPAPVASSPAPPRAAGSPGPATASGSASATAQTSGQPALKTTPPPSLQAKDPTKALADHFKDDPYKPLPGVNRSVAQEPPEIKNIEAAIAQKEKETKEIIDRLQKRAVNSGIMTGKQGVAYVKDKVSQYRRELETFRKEQNQQLTEVRKHQYEQERDEKRETAPHRLSTVDAEGAEQAFKTARERMQAEAKQSPRGEAAKDGKPASPEFAASEKRKLDLDNSVLRYAKTPNDLAPLHRIAKNIMAQNPNTSPDEAFNTAVRLTSILRPSTADKDPRGANLQKGAGATTFLPQTNLRKELTLILPPDDRTVKLDRNSYRDVVAMHRANWADWEQNSKKIEDEAKKGAGAKAGVRALIPQFMGTIGSGAISGR